MTAVTRAGLAILLVSVCLAAACRLKRPETVPARMLEPQMTEPARQASAADAAPIRLLETQARGHIGRRLLYRQPTGELTEDPSWRWSSPPDRYLDTALRLELAASPGLRLVDAPSAQALAANLVAWHLESADGSRLVGAVEFQFTRTDRGVQTYVVRASEPVSADLPGDLAAVAGRLLRRLASDGLTQLPRER